MGCLFVLSIFGACMSAAPSEEWPCWRGPRGDGTSIETDVPVEWNGQTGHNIAWKTELPAHGHSSPIVFGQFVFVTGCIEETQQRVLMCFQRSDGKLLWQSVVTTSTLEKRHKLNSYASGTPATDGKHVYATFLVTDGREVPAPNVGSPRPVTPGEILVAAFDFEGKALWSVSPGGFTSVHGFCSSPVIYGNLLIINGDHDGDSYVAALDRSNGEVVWKTPREHKTRSYCTPIIRTIEGRDQMVLTGSKRVVSMDPRSGALNWLIEGPTEQFVSSMVYDGEKFYLTAGFPTHHVMAVRPSGQGDVTSSHVAWHSEAAKCYVPSPVLQGRYLFVADDRGTVNCFDKESGDRIWQDRLGNHYSASLVTAGGLVYFTADDGTTAVVKPGDKLDVLHRNPLGEFTYASPAISDGQIFFRGDRYLTAVGK
ncbi:MAG: PQQ-binding-like beta-propeller repeat protein [Planctomycetaceae bacterium]|nr:PQQ-binding-like beta-propeller repeat protein [Planctomycetaceae bacterium]